MAFRDEPTAGVDHKFTSVRVVPSVDHLSSFTCRGLETQRVLRRTEQTSDFNNMTLHKSQICCMEDKSLSKHATVGWCNQTVLLKIGNIFTDVGLCALTWVTALLRCWFNGVIEREYDGLAC